MTVNILGTEYTITVKKYDEDEAFERNSMGGYCDGLTKNIVVCDMKTYKGWEHEPQETIEAAQKQAIRHEIVHRDFLTAFVRFIIIFQNGVDGFLRKRTDPKLRSDAFHNFFLRLLKSFHIRLHFPHPFVTEKFLFRSF